MPSSTVPEFPLHGPYSLARLQALAAAAGPLFDAPPRAGWHEHATALIPADGMVLSVSGTMQRLPVALVFSRRAVSDTGTWHETRVQVALDTGPVRVELLRGFSTGPKLSSGVAAFERELTLQGTPRELAASHPAAPRAA